MKKFILKIGMMVAIALSFSAAADAQIRVRVRPTFTITNRPERPSPRHVWVSDEWRWNNGNYEHVNGYWATPNRGRRGWVEGHWRHTRGGWTWVPGHWR